MGLFDRLKEMFSPPEGYAPRRDDAHRDQVRDEVRHHDRDLYRDEARRDHGSSEQRHHPESTPPDWGSYGNDNRSGW